MRQVYKRGVMSIALLALATAATAPGLTPRLRAVSRWLRSATHFSRRISRIFRIGTRSVAIRSLSPPWDKGANRRAGPQRRTR